jgi:hypothetical protein
MTLDPSKILQLGSAFWGSKALLSAVELGLFTTLASGPLAGEELARRHGLHARAWRDFFDALVALGMLERGADGRYANTPETARFLDKGQPGYVGGLLEMLNSRLYGFWGGLTTALRTGKPQNEIARDGEGLFEALYADPARLEQFLSAMTGVSQAAAAAIAEKFPWEKYATFVDVGGAQGCVPVHVARAHSHLTGVNFDLPAVGPIFDKYVKAAGLQARLRFEAGSFFERDLPKADVLIFGHILHDWNLETKRMLLKKAHAALPRGGAVIVYEALIDDERRQNAFGLLMSLNMLIETPDGFDYTGADCQGWMRDAGFRETSVVHLAGPDSMVIGIK